MNIVPKVFAHTSYIGTGGYNNHSRDFFRHLSKLIDVKVRNFTTTPNWLGVIDEPHNNEEYINNTDKKLLDIQNLWKDASVGLMSDHKIYSKYKNEFKHNINLILSETDHHYYYHNYVGPKIGYNVWESTLQPEGFFKKWKEFDQLWVPSKWQAQCTINQGVDPNKVKVVPEGVDTTTFYPDDVNHKEYDDGRFKFILFGRWDYRKSTKEIIETFLKTFLPDEPIDLILSIDNMFGERIDGFTTTEERLKYWNLQDNRLKIKHFPSREDYIKYIKKGHVFLSCSRSEGWNLPLIEAMACGTPSIYSNCSAQLEFAEGKGLPVNIIGEQNLNYNKDPKWKMAMITAASGVGNYYKPDFDDLSKVMRDAYENYDKHKTKALKDAKIIHKDFNWDKVAEIGRDTLVDFMKNYKEIEDKNEIIVTYNNGPKVEIIGDINKEYFVEFIDKSCNCVIYKDTIKNNMWTSCGRKYFTEWVIKINGEVVDELNLNGRDVIIEFESSSIGDTIAWFPYVEEFRKKHKCNIICKTFHNSWFEKKYSNIKFIKPGSVININDINYKMGWFYSGDDVCKWDRDYHPHSFLPQPLQKTASDILGLEFKELKPLFSVGSYNFGIEGKYVTLAIQSTSQCKYWNHPTGWQEVVDYLNDSGYKVVLVDQFTQFGRDECINIAPKNVIIKSKGGIDEVISIINKAEFHLGVSSGLSWVAWAVNTPVVMVSSFTPPWLEFTTDCIRIYNDTPTSGYFSYYKLDASNWNWYPYKELNSLKDWYEVENITPEQVINQIKTII